VHLGRGSPALRGLLRLSVRVSAGTVGPQDYG
jgi:hypothetical protein